MHNILTIAKKELRSYFLSSIAYVVFAMFLLLAGYFFTVILLYTQEASLKGAAYNIVITLLFLIPLLTMKAFAEERRQGTLELLMTKPVTDFEVVMGKFFAATTMYLIMLLTTVVYVFILIKYGNPDMGPIYSAYIGLILVGLAFISLGVFASTLTENQIVAAVIGFALILLLWVLSWASSQFTGNMAEIISYLSLSGHYDNFVKGVIDLKDVVYYLSFIIFWLFVTVKSIEVRHWK